MGQTNFGPLYLCLLCLCGCAVLAVGSDCSLGSDTSDGVTCTYTYNGVGYNYRCSASYECCDTGSYGTARGCCLKASGASYNAYEIAGLVLSISSLATLALLTLMIIGATYCNSKEDKSRLFGGGKD